RCRVWRCGMERSWSEGKAGESGVPTGQGSRVLLRAELVTLARPPAPPAPEPTGENEPTPDERMPPRETRTELGRTTARTPEAHRESNATEVQTRDTALEPLPPDAKRYLPRPYGPLYFFYCSHHLFPESNK